MKKVIVIGGGPAGMMAAGQAALRGNTVTLIEKMNRVGRKLYITGKGRCNVTNASAPEGLIANTPGNPYFLYSAFYTFTSDSTMEFFEQQGVPVKVERGNRVFPKSEKSNDIVRAMENFVKKSGGKIMYETEVSDIIIENNCVKGVKLKNGTILDCDSIVIATGGLSYPMTGSTGDGYKFAKKVGHTVTKCYPSLVPLKASEKWISDLMGLSLKNISIKVTIDNKEVYSDFGEMMFTHFGVTGPVILSASRYINDRLDEKPVIHIDLKPALSAKELDNRLLKDFHKYVNKDFKNALDDLLPQKLIPVIIKLSAIDENKKVNSITKEERTRLLELIKNLTINITDTNGYNEAVVTRGGISVDEIDPSTMESKIVSGLYFAGEVIDVDSFTGGFNLQIAFSTGYLAGTNC
ncbi:MAG: NAD(P)/FAD-dependent oxidoreductase [Lachnospirales bacterium]